MRPRWLWSIVALAGCEAPCPDPLDRDEDGVAAAVDCDDADPGVGGPVAWYPDCDGDGLALDAPVTACAAPTLDPDGVGPCRWVGVDEPRGDCDDADDTLAEAPAWYPDCDGDGAFGPAVAACAAAEVLCAADEPPLGEVSPSEPTGLDCDDADDAIADPVAWHPDCDDDGHGGPAVGTACAPPAHTCAGGGAPPGWVADETAPDCDDTAAAVSPSADELPGNGVDDDCDPATPDALPPEDLDADGHAADVDCDDLDPARYPGAPETWGDGVDQDCDGTDLEAPDPADLYVAPTGDDLGAGTAADPFRTIGRAAQLGAPERTIRVAAGVYAESATISASLVGGYRVDGGAWTWDPDAGLTEVVGLPGAAALRVKRGGSAEVRRLAGVSLTGSSAPGLQLVGEALPGLDVVLHRVEARQATADLASGVVTDSAFTMQQGAAFDVVSSPAGFTFTRTTFSAGAPSPAFGDIGLLWRASGRAALVDSEVIASHRGVRAASGEVRVERSRIAAVDAALDGDIATFEVFDAVLAGGARGIQVNGAGTVRVVRSEVWADTSADSNTAAIEQRAGTLTVATSILVGGDGGAFLNSQAVRVGTGATVVLVNSLLDGGGGPTTIAFVQQGAGTLWALNTAFTPTPLGSAATRGVPLSLLDTAEVILDHCLFEWGSDALIEIWDQGTANRSTVVDLADVNDCAAWPGQCVATASNVSGLILLEGLVGERSINGESLARDRGVDPGPQDWVPAEWLDPDLAGNPRPLGAGWDIGPLELVP